MNVVMSVCVFASGRGGKLRVKSMQVLPTSPDSALTAARKMGELMVELGVKRFTISVYDRSTPEGVTESWAGIHYHTCGKSGVYI